MARICSTCPKPLARGTKGDKCRPCSVVKRPERFCGACGTKISARQNKSGFCRRCLLARVGADPAIVEKRNVAVRKALARPETRAKMRANQLRVASDPEMIARWREAGRRNYHLTVGSPKALAAARSPEVIARRAATHHERDMAWCPVAYRDQYTRLMRQHSAAVARPMILQQIERDRLQSLTTLNNLESAVYHLRRFTSVFKKGDAYLYGTVTLTPEQLIKRALDKGWDPHRWAA